jgi:hypothetical protein
MLPAPPFGLKIMKSPPRNPTDQIEGFSNNTKAHPYFPKIFSFTFVEYFFDNMVQYSITLAL